MLPIKVLQAIEEALRGSYQIKLTFNKESTKEIYHLLAMDLTEIIRLPWEEKERLETVAKNGKWDLNSNRTITVIMTNRLIYFYHKELFIKHLYKAVEGIKVVS